MPQYFDDTQNNKNNKKEIWLSVHTLCIFPLDDIMHISIVYGSNISEYDTFLMCMKI